MMDFLKNLRLSVFQWVGVMAAAVIGFLVMLLRLQGKKIHRLQVQALEQQVEHAIRTDEEKVESARDTFQQALKAYTDAGGKL